ncbi:Uncharacterized conserved protein [Actinobacillus lignieresii]|nr:Uncharacterized conserved protein [Actinobacillus lignieresii]
MLANQLIVSDIKTIIHRAREQAIRSVDFQRVIMYWHIGERIFKEEQQEKERAEYGSGFSKRQLERYRQFYRTFPIVSALRTQLNWTQYKLLLSIPDEVKREFYIAETVKNNWSSRQLERQIYSNLYERLLLSNDKESVLAVAQNQVVPNDPKQIIKDPIVLEFLGLKRESTYYEKDLESAILTHLQDFLLELGNGFSFVARQK